jgi:hypothetical protein
VSPGVRKLLRRGGDGAAVEGLAAPAP